MRSVRLRRRRALGPTDGERLRYAIDELNADGVVGWAVAPGERVGVDVVVDGRKVGAAAGNGYRIDVAQSVAVAGAEHSGFEFRFSPAHFSHVDAAVADVQVVVHAGAARVVTEPVTVPVLGPREPRPPEVLAPLPPDVVGLLRRLRPGVYEAPWDEDVAGRAVADLALLLRRGSRDVPALHRYLSLLGQLWLRAAFVERYFPRANTAADTDAKDRSAVQNSAVEVYAVAAHLVTAASYGLDGPLLEFGCFKGFSTAILSDACHQLGQPMHVFDSFAGLPASESTYYRAGEFAGSRSEVEQNVRTYGRAAAVTLHQGFFSDTIPTVDIPTAAQMWMDVDLESSAKDALQLLPKLDRRGALFSHECPPEAFEAGRVTSSRSPEAVIPPILDAFAADHRRVAARHVYGNTGAFWDADEGIPVLPTTALLALRDLAVGL